MLEAEAAAIIVVPLPPGRFRAFHAPSWRQPALVLFLVRVVAVRLDGESLPRIQISVLCTG